MMLNKQHISTPSIFRLSHQKSLCVKAKWVLILIENPLILKIPTEVTFQKLALLLIIALAANLAFLYQNYSSIIYNNVYSNIVFYTTLQKKKPYEKLPNYPLVFL